MAKKKKAKKQSTNTPSIMGIIAWLTGVLVSLSVGFGMIGEVLTIPYIPNVVTIIAGWIVVIGVILSVVLAIFNQ